MPKYTKLLTPEEFEKLTIDQKGEYLVDMAEILKTHRDYTQRPVFPLPPEKPKTH